MPSPIPHPGRPGAGRHTSAPGRLLRWLAVTAAVLAATSTALPATATAPGSTGVQHPGVTCPMGTPVVEPTFVPISCGDGSAFVIHVRWTYLSTHLGRAKGIVLLDDCVPNCAAGHYRAYGARLVFTDVAMTRARPYFTRLRIHFTSRHPAGPKVWTATY